MPEGYEPVISETNEKGITHLGMTKIYRGGGGFLMLSFSGEKAFMDNVHYDIRQMTINGNYADVFVSTHERYSDAVVMYFDDEDVFVWISCFGLLADELIKVAEGIEYET